MWCQGLAKLLEAENSSFCVGLMVKEQKYNRLEKLNVQRENVVLQILMSLDTVVT